MNRGVISMDELVSVIIPTYNREQFIIEALQSVLNQSYERLEVIIVDDGSTDKTVEIIKKMSDPRIKILVNEKNEGACFSRNRGVIEAKGNYIAFQDSDDIWEKNKLEICLDYLKKENADVVFSSYVLNDNIIVPSYNLNNFKNKVKQVLIKNCISTQTIVGKKNVFLDEQFDVNMPRYQDFDLSVRLLSKYKVYYVDQPLVKVYQQEDSITKQSLKGVFALERMLSKYKLMIVSDKDLASNFYSNLGVHYEKAGINGKEYFRKSLKYKFNMKVLVRYILSSLMLYAFVDSIIWRHR